MQKIQAEFEKNIEEKLYSCAEVLSNYLGSDFGFSLILFQDDDQDSVTDAGFISTEQNKFNCNLMMSVANEIKTNDDFSKQRIRHKRTKH